MLLGAAGESAAKEGSSSTRLVGNYPRRCNGGQRIGQPRSQTFDAILVNQAIKAAPVFLGPGVPTVTQSHCPRSSQRKQKMDAPAALQYMYAVEAHRDEYIIITAD